MSSTVRETALDHISTAQPVAPLPAPEQGKALANGYGCDVFNTRVMRQRLPREVYDRLMRTMTHRTPLDPADADIIAGSHEGLGSRTRRYALHPLVPAHDRADG